VDSYKKAPVWIVFLFFGSVIAGIPIKQKTEWKGTIETENGIKVIKNPREPLYGKIKFELKQDLSIGKKGDKNYTFYNIKDILVDGQSNIYATDFGHYRVQIYDKNGLYIRTVGKHGTGPGEFQWFMVLRRDDLNGNLFIQDGANTIKIFDKQGQYLEQIPVDKPINGFNLDGNGNFIAIQETVTLEERSKALCKINPKGEIFSYFVKFPWEILVEKREMGIGVGYIETYELLMSIIGGRKIVYGYSKDYELNVIDFEGQPILRMKKDAIPRPFPKEQVQRYKKIGAKIVPYRPFFYAVLTDSKNRIYVQKNGIRIDNPQVINEIDIFSEDGYYLYESVIPRRTRLIRDGFLYAYDLEKDKIIRYRIKNWDQIKVGI
jgi:hypothetical protein